MRILFAFLFWLLCYLNNQAQEKVPSQDFPKIEIRTVLQDSISIRALAISDSTIYYAGTDGKYGYIDFQLQNGFDVMKTGKFEIKEGTPNFRSIATTSTHFFLLSIESPALLYKVDKNSEEARLVYHEDHEKSFYDAMVFWDNTEGIAMGDPTESCLSIIITRDDGESWNKISCKNLPETVKGEAAFAASNGNISVVGDHIWIVTGGMKSRVFYSEDRGRNWSVIDTPIVRGTPTTGAYSVDFYDKNMGIIYGGDYTKPEQNKNNIAVTHNGGKSWSVFSGGDNPGYKSCVRYVPNGKGKKIVAVGFTGIIFSNDSGQHWRKLSSEGFYTIRFINESLAVAAGKNRISLIKFK